MPDRGPLMNPKLLIMVLKFAIALVEIITYLTRGYLIHRSEVEQNESTTAQL
jgi:hypothetical protein